MMQEFEQKLARRAATNHELFGLLGSDTKAHTPALQRMIEAADLFFALLPDGGSYIVKGKKRLDTIVAAATEAAVAVDALRVSCAEEAEAMRLIFGDGASNMRSTSERRVHVTAGGKKQTELKS